MSWTDERIELLKKLWDDGLSCSQIAAELHGITRNAVIGKAHRLGLAGRKRPDQPRAPRPKRQRTFNLTKLFAIRDQTDPGLIADLEPEIIANPIGIFALNESTCRWPVSGSGAETMFCGSEPLTGFPYCGRHSRWAYVGAEREISERERAARDYRRRQRELLKAAMGQAA